MQVAEHPKRVGSIDLRIGERIKQARLVQDKSQEWLAGRLGVSFQQIQKYEKGANRVSAGRLMLIAEELKCSLSWFFGGEPFPNDIPTVDVVLASKLAKLPPKHRAAIENLVDVLGAEVQ
ncbi:helix-turn-helix domain-containing protein [Microvirga puerhi]|uniref:Helix-turn-helix domain-containing protein n=1 Tax=Microvirga puerhi TaxID=2876078 RepID=A0ABS7VV27_9HYPH|nr:helix-turn-helix transcriptional regulator [Microvirga puerhi]MBZ6078900.1 helix-turn-helix domain-containing protein [Microvirga puerhi]